MNITPIEMIYDFNDKAGLLTKGYSDEKECAFPIEEALEGLELTYLARVLGEHDVTPKNLSRRMTSLTRPLNNLLDVDRLDKHLDIIVFSFGSIFKLGLTPKEALEALTIVMEANMSKLSVGTDSHGKQMKPVDFVSPEYRLQDILDRRVYST